MLVAGRARFSSIRRCECTLAANAQGPSGHPPQRCGTQRHDSDSKGQEISMIDKGRRKVLIPISSANLGA